MSAKSSKEYDDAMQKINEWRTLHLEALDALQNEILPLLKQSNIAISLTSRRLKRITSILYKLDINPEMRLGGMQDIGGFRIVVNDIDALHSVKKTQVSDLDFRQFVHMPVVLPASCCFR